jgi:enterochelin esterase-like enzyme
VLAAVRPKQPGLQLSQPGTITVSDDGRTKFTPSASGKHRYVIVDPAQKSQLQQVYVELASAKPVPRMPRRRPPQQQQQQEQQQQPQPAKTFRTMKSLNLAACLIVSVASAFAQAQAPAAAEPKPARPQMPQLPNTDIHYKLAPDAIPQEGVPVGEVRGPFTLPSEVYPGTQHTYWVYVPAQYDSKVPASLMIYNDGQAFMNPQGDMRAQVVMDNLIYRREIPVMIGVFINPGRRPDQPEPTQSNWGDRDTNRGVEYNSLDDKYARVIVDELLPALYKDYNISKDPERHGIGGSSSGAIAAFTVTWERPDHFRKVLSNVGSFVNLRGGHAYADIVRKSEKKPLRVFLVDGRNDNRGQRPGGAYDPTRDWFLQNVRLQQALTEKGYDVNYSWGIQRHGQKMLQTVLPEMMRWLWRDHGVSTDVNDMVERSFNRGPVR